MKIYFQEQLFPVGRSRPDRTGVADFGNRPAFFDQLRAAIRVVETGLRGVIERAQGRGFVRAGLAVGALAAWSHGVLAGRVISDNELADVEPERWARLSQQAVVSLAFGDIAD